MVAVSLPSLTESFKAWMSNFPASVAPSAKVREEMVVVVPSSRSSTSAIWSRTFM